jgi:hypothetical protein
MVKEAIDSDIINASIHSFNERKQPKKRSMAALRVELRCSSVVAFMGQTLALHSSAPHSPRGPGFAGDVRYLPWGGYTELLPYVAFQKGEFWTGFSRLPDVTLKTQEVEGNLDCAV